MAHAVKLCQGGVFAAGNERALFKLAASIFRFLEGDVDDALLREKGSDEQGS
jgi:hypothetical protein